MEDLLASQNQIMGAMDQLLINFKKDGADRKTPAHIKKRLSTLESYWQEFQSNHLKLFESDDKSHEYFTGNYYKRTSDFYNETRNYILSYLPSDSKEKSLLRPATPLQKTGFSAIPSASALRPETTADAEASRTQGTSSKLEDMLRKQRSNFKAFQRTISSIDLDKVSEKWEYEDILKSVQARWTIIDALHWEIDSELYEDNEEYEEMFSSYEQKFNNIKKVINSKMWSDLYREKTTPKMDIPMFSGSYHQWLSFKDLFVEAIHSNRALSNSQKMQFLKSKLKGEAEKIVQHLQISTDNYQVCWDLLNQRYNNTKLIFNSHMSVLVNQPTIQQQSASAIKKIHDTTNECLNAIKNLGVNIENWDPMIVYLITQKLDADTHNDYIESLKHPRDLPTIKDLLQFLEVKFTALESSKRKPDLQKSNQQPQQSSQPSNFKKPFVFKAFTSNQNPSFKSNNFNNKSRLASAPKQKCPVCNKDHAIPYCETFSTYRPDFKRQIISKLSLCQNCLYNHNGNECFSKKRCHKCQSNHHTLVHEAFTVSANAANPSASTDRAVSNSHVSLEDTQEILLATAIINVQAVDGTLHSMRALIDQGSQTSIITENGAQRLGLPRKHCKGVILGVGAKENSCKGVMNITLSSCYSAYSINLDVFIMNHAVNNLPNKSFGKPSWAFIENIQLADPEFYRSRTVDLLLGADVYSSIIMGGIIKENDDMPIAQQTRLGWILCGNVKSYNCNVIMVDIDSIHKFWSIEDINDTEEMSSEDHQCLQKYQETTFRQPDGRYVVRLPLHPDAEEKLGLSEPKACAQFYQLERKFGKNQNLANNYKQFMNEYINLRHMHTIAANLTPIYYMSHHAVERPDSLTTSLRVVFNASGKTSSGVCLNDVLYRGPNLQQELLVLVLKWRQYKYAFTADLEKMFRQIIVHPDDQLYQCIVWRENSNQPLSRYQLNTVTYGTKSAPFLAMMTLKQLAIDERQRYPEASKALEQHFYMDDALCGSYDVTSAKKLQQELIDLLKTGGFNLRKFSSNEKSLLEDVDVAPSSPNTYDFKHQESTKALGLTWIAKDDNFTFQCKMTAPTTTKPTKRVLLAEISKVFDPCGFLSPAVVQLKLLFQSVWQENLNWDDVIPDDVYSKWLTLRADIENISDIEIPRWIGTGKESKVQLHGFCDSSTKAFACVVYARIVHKDTASVTILAAKTKLVPSSKTSTKNKISLPRLELSSALLLSKLMTKIKLSLIALNLEVYGWSDSTAALGWIQGDPNRWKPFVANRVKKITDVMPPECWRYVKSTENPADCASRGMKVEQLQQHTLWWKGPLWLSSSADPQENPRTYQTDLECKVKLSNIVQTNKNNDEIDIISAIIHKQSSFTRATRVLAWILRAISKNSVKLPYLTTAELRNATEKIIMSVQKSEFSQEINDLSKLSKVDSKSKLLCLNPFLDQNGLLRVGGRLKNSNIPYDMKHPYIIPHSGHLTNILIDLAHKSTFHGGARLTQAWLRQQYWILGGNKVVRNRLRRCVICKRHNPEKNEQLMGELPEARTNSTRPFFRTGLDFTGYIDIKANKGRGIKTNKGYVAVFICMVTKAVHLELVSDLSSSAFLAALRRLAARKGTPRHLYSDNGTNFIGANNILSKEYFDLKSILSEEFFTEISEMKIDWHFNAPSWPSAGGLWEAAVKSLKHHLRRVVGDQKLTYEEFSTLLAQLEACLNSRPLCVLSEDPDDINYLTPAHFLSSGPILSIIETETDGRTRWQLTQKIFSDIWKRWRAEYLVQLSARSKWRESRENIKLDDVVVIHDANLPPGKWALGRVIELHPGTDNLVRVVSVKTRNGSVIKRPVIKLSILPVNID